MGNRRKGKSKGRGRSKKGRGRGGRAWKDAVDSEIMDMRGRLVEIRRDLHRHPELAFEETRTAKTVAEHLEDLGLDVETGIAGTGVVGILEGDLPGPVVMYRADMDGLPIEEKPKGDYTSRNEGVMHACGHDGHMAIAIGAAQVLSERRDELHGTVKFVFQPGEEGGGGGKKMVDAAVLKRPDVDAAFGLHLDNEHPTGTVCLSAGEAMAASGDFSIKLEGKGGHAATPHLCSDPVVAASYLVTALQAIVSRQVDPTKDVVLSIGSINGGTAENVIPKSVVLEGTVRAFDEDLQKEVLGRIDKITKGIASGFDLKSHVERRRGYPPTANHPEITKEVQAILTDMLGKDAIQPMHVLGSEDMAFFLRQVPGCFFFLGSRNDGKGCNAPHHSPEFDFDEDALPLGVHVATTILEEYLEAHAEEGKAREKKDRRKKRSSKPKREERGRRKKAKEEEEEPEEVAAEEEEDEDDDDLDLAEMGYVPEQDFQRTRRRRRRVGSREKREALLPEHLGPRAKDAEKAAIEKFKEDYDPEEDEDDEGDEPEAEERGRGDRRGRGDDRRRSRRGRGKAERREKEEEKDEEEDDDEPDLETVVASAEEEADEDEDLTARERKIQQAREVSSVEDDDLVPLHKRKSKAKEDEEEQEKGPVKPWLWKGKKGRR